MVYVSRLDMHIAILYVLTRGRMRTSLDAEFMRFNQFLNEIEAVTNQINQVYIDHLKFDVDLKNSFTNEEVIINRAITKLLEAIKLARQSLREIILASEQKKIKVELTLTVLQVAHDIGSPLAVLEVIIDAYVSVLPEEVRISVKNAVMRIRNITNSFLKKAKQDAMLINDESLS